MAQPIRLPNLHKYTSRILLRGGPLEILGGVGEGGRGAKNFQCMNFVFSQSWLQEFFSHVEGLHELCFSIFFLLCYVKLQIRINYRFRSFGAIILARIEYRKWTELLKGKQLIPLYLMRLFLYFRIKNQETRTYHELTMLPSSIKNDFITDGTKL